MLFPLWVNDFPAKIFIQNRGEWDVSKGGVKCVFRAGVLSLQLRLPTQAPPPPPISQVELKYMRGAFPIYSMVSFCHPFCDTGCLDLVKID